MFDLICLLACRSYKKHLRCIGEGTQLNRVRGMPVIETYALQFSRTEWWYSISSYVWEK